MVIIIYPSSYIGYSTVFIMSIDSAIKRIAPLDFIWQTRDPFLFCAYHYDLFPNGNGRLGPAASLNGRNIGQDFQIKDGWRMYHGDRIPGFPAHPHRGFETVTVVTKGLVDHADSLNAAGRYGDGDTQWMTAGKGVQHSEMFPMVHEDKPNHLELFQIWLNLPAKSKMVEPHFLMLWDKNTPWHRESDSQGKQIAVRVVAGPLGDQTPASPPPDSWAGDLDNKVAIWIIELDEHASWTLPKESSDINRTLYFYDGNTLDINGQAIDPMHLIEVTADQSVTLTNGNQKTYLLMLQGKPIKEPVAQHGPFVMNTQEELRQTFHDYNQTQFGGWPWKDADQTHGKNGRFAQHANGDNEEP